MKRYLILLLCVFFINFINAQNANKIEPKVTTILSIENLLQQYIQIPSVSGQEKEAGDFLKAFSKNNGLIITDFGSNNGHYNFAASIFPLSDKKPNIIFLTHLDVLPETNESKYGAYSGKKVNGKIYGRGAIDNKGAALMQLYSILKILQDKNTELNKFNITFLAVSCEETQCDGGVNYVVDHYLDILNPVVVLGEGPSELTTIIGGKFKNPIFGVSIAQKRAFWLKLELNNHTLGHGSITPLKYGNKEMVKSLNNLTKKKNKVLFTDLNIRLLKSLANHKKGIEKLVLKHPKLFKPLLAPKLRKQPELFALFSNTITLTNIYTNGDNYNEIPTKTGAYLDCRLLPDTDENKFLEMVKHRLNNDSIKITVIKSKPKSKPSSIKNIYFKNLKEAIIEKYPSAEILPIMLPNINDLSFFRTHQIPAFASIPVYFTRDQVQGVHGINEYISIKSLYDGTAVYYNFLKKMESNSISKN